MLLQFNYSHQKEFNIVSYHCGSNSYANIYILSSIYVFFSFLFHQTELSPAPKKIVEKKPEDKLFDLVPMNRFDAEEMEKMERRKKMSPTSKGNGFLSNM